MIDGGQKQLNRQLSVDATSVYDVIYDNNNSNNQYGIIIRPLYMNIL